MLHLTQFFSRATRKSDDAIAAAKPEDFLVLRDGEPFAFLNATPTLAERTVSGFARATPGAHWALTRCC